MFQVNPKHFQARNQTEISRNPITLMNNTEIGMGYKYE